MIIVPGQPAVQETRHSRELSRRVDDVISNYRRDNPDVSEGEVRTALLRSAPPGGLSDRARRRKAGLVGGTAALIGAFSAVAGRGGDFDKQTWLLVCAIVAGVAAIAFATFRLARRD